MIGQYIKGNRLSVGSIRVPSFIVGYELFWQKWSVFIALFLPILIPSYLHKWHSLKEREISYQTACYFLRK